MIEEYGVGGMREQKYHSGISFWPKNDKNPSSRAVQLNYIKKKTEGSYGIIHHVIRGKTCVPASNY